MDAQITPALVIGQDDNDVAFVDAQTAEYEAAIDNQLQEASMVSDDDDDDDEINIDDI